MALGLALAGFTNLLISPTKILPVCSNDIQRQVVPTFDTGCLVGWIIHFEILNFRSGTVLEKKSTAPIHHCGPFYNQNFQGKWEMFSIITTTTLGKENHML
jgi:hypothetical protein